MMLKRLEIENLQIRDFIAFVQIPFIDGTMDDIVAMLSCLLMAPR